MGILHKKHYLNQTGLTLVEVLIALAIVSIALTAVIKSTSENIRGTSHLENKTIATWVGTNVINEIRTGILRMALAEKQRGMCEMLGRNWYWQAQVDETGNDHIKKISVSVSIREDSKPVVTLESYRYDAES